MPLKGQIKRDYDVAYKTQRRNEWIVSQGSRCAVCGTEKGPWEIDHIDPSTKSYTISTIWTRRKEIRDYELAKCQLLCRLCHTLKTQKEATIPLEHGSYIRGYGKGCHCSMCMEAMRIHWREYRARKKLTPVV